MSVNNPGKKKSQYSTDPQKESSKTQVFEFVAFEDAHRARSYAMRQSWRKRKQKRLAKSHEEEANGGNVETSEKRAKQRLLAAKVRASSLSQARSSEPDCEYRKPAVLGVESLPKASGGIGDIADFSGLDHAEYMVDDNGRIIELSDDDLQFIQSLGQDDEINEYFDHYFSAEQPLMDFSTLAADNILSPLALDPFDTFPISLMPRHHELLHHWLSSHAAMMFNDSPSPIDFNPMRDVWFPLDLSNAASFYGIMAHSAAHMAYLRGQGKNGIVEVLKYKTEAVSLINKWMHDKDMALSDSTFAAVIRLLTFERYWGSEEAWLIHREGLDKMIQARGGLSSLKQNWRLGLVLQLVSLMSKPSWFYPSNNISEISDSFSYLRVSDKENISTSLGAQPFMNVDEDSTNSEIPKLRSLWLISFIQDMRSLMANSSNLQSEGLRHYHSIYEAITILRTSFLESIRSSADPSFSNLYEHDRIACLFYIGVMIQECVSSKYHNTIADTSSQESDTHAAVTQINAVAAKVDEKSYDRLATLNKALSEHQSIWKASITQLEGFLLNHFMNHWGNVNRAEYVLHMTEVLTSLSREARNGVERVLLNMFGGKYVNLSSFGEPDGGVGDASGGSDKDWTVDELLMTIRGG